MDIDGVGSGLTRLPITAHCPEPELEFDHTSVALGEVFLRYTYPVTIPIHNETERWSTLKVQLQDENSKSVDREMQDGRWNSIQFVCTCVDRASSFPCCVTEHMCHSCVDG